jgi:hypothetical protein
MLDLQVSKSAPFSGGCGPNLAVPVAPEFNLAALSIAAQPTNSGNGKALGLQGLIASVDAGGTGFTVNALGTTNANGFPAWQVKVGSGTVFQGVANAGQLAAGMPVDMDLDLQSDASLLATRVAIADANTADVSYVNGPVLLVAQAVPAMVSLTSRASGAWFSSGYDNYNLGTASFQIGGQYANLQNLPFAANFSAANMVAGQNISLTTHLSGPPPGSGYVTPSTITLMPQTMNGTISAVATEGNFTVYTVTLAGYDLFSTLAVQQGQKILLTNPGTLMVYADSSTQKLNAVPLTAGSVLRFHGLVFNDNGTLRMDCAEINDGVTE